MSSPLVLSVPPFILTTMVRPMILLWILPLALSSWVMILEEKLGLWINRAPHIYVKEHSLPMPTAPLNPLLCLRSGPLMNKCYHWTTSYIQCIPPMTPVTPSVKHKMFWSPTIEHLLGICLVNCIVTLNPHDLFTVKVVNCSTQPIIIHFH